MLKRNIIFRVDADDGSEAGTGHLKRILLLKEYFKNKNKRYNFIYLYKNLKNSRKIFLNFKNKIIYRSNFEEKLIDISPKDFLIVDTPFGVDQKMKDFILKKKIKKILLIDDINKPKIKGCIIYNGIIFLKKKIKVKECKIFQSLNSIIIDPNYLKSFKKKRNLDILVTVGGTDKKQILYKICNYLIKNTNYKITAIAGSQVKESNPIHKLKNKNLKIINSPKSLIKFMNCHNLIFCTGGISMFEALTLNKTILVYQSFLHQKHAINYFSRKEQVIKIGENDKLFKYKIKNFFKYKIKKKYLKKNTIDGKGFLRLTKILDKHFINEKKI